MSMFEMSQLMRQHRLHFRRRELLQQGVKKYHALASAKACEKRIGMCRSFAAIHHKETLGCETSTLHQSIDSLLQCFIL